MICRCFHPTLVAILSLIFKQKKLHLLLLPNITGNSHWLTGYVTLHSMQLVSHMQLVRRNLVAHMAANDMQNTANLI